MTKIKNFKIEYIVYLYIILCPILDIASYLFRNAFDTQISVSTFLRPIIPIVLAIYIFIKANKKNKLILIGIAAVYLIYGVVHLLVTNTFITGCSYGDSKQELQYVINYTFLVFNLVVFYYLFKNSNVLNLQIAILVMCAIYIVSIYLAILTGTSSYTYAEEQIGYKGWIESGNSLSAILCISTFLILPLIKNKKYRIPTIIILILIGVYLVALIGTRVGLIGFFLAVAVFVCNRSYF